jgi:hypothetical protein
MSTIIFNPALFREQFPAFQCTPPISDDLLQLYFANATLYISSNKNQCFGGLNIAQKTQALYLMTAHLTQISRNIAQNQVTGVMTAATVDKVSITLEPPPSENQWQYWLNSTPYGQQLFALLQVVGIGGRYIGASPAISSFRRPYYGFY